jgi:hypothetical protein
LQVSGFFYFHCRLEFAAECLLHAQLHCCIRIATNDFSCCY